MFDEIHTVILMTRQSLEMRSWILLFKKGSCHHSGFGSLELRLLGILVKQKGQCMAFRSPKKDEWQLYSHQHPIIPKPSCRGRVCCHGNGIIEKLASSTVATVVHSCSYQGRTSKSKFVKQIGVVLIIV